MVDLRSLLPDADRDDVERRTLLFMVAVVLIFAVLVVRLGYLQLSRGRHYEALARGNRIRLVYLTAPRGALLDRTGEIVATTRPSFAASLVYMGEPYTDDVLAKLEGILSLAPGRIRELLRRERGRLYLPIRLKNDITPEEHTKLEEHRHELPGVVIEVVPIREYPNGAMTAHALGYVGLLGAEDAKLQAQADAQAAVRAAAGMPGVRYELNNTIGMSGLERQYDAILRGTDGVREVEVDSRGNPSRVEREVAPQPGLTLKLTLDLKLQLALDRALMANIERVKKLRTPAHATAAAAVVVDVKTGGVLAMTSWPAYDPNWFSSGNVDLGSVEWLNRVTQGRYIPGSTYKMVTAIAALEEGVVTPRDMVYCPGGYRMGRDYIRCWVGDPGHGWLNMVGAISKSCNAYFLEMGARLRAKVRQIDPIGGGIDLMSNYAALLGLDGQTGIDVPGELAGRVPRTGTRQWLPGEDIQSAMGQSRHAYTPLQLAQYVATIANNGVGFRPYLMDQILDGDKVIFRTQPEILNQATGVSQQTLDLVKQGMLAVTRAGGTAYGSFWDIPIQVAAKTGTAQTGRPLNNGLFVGFAPFDDPQIAWVIVVEGGDSGSLSGGPVAREIVRTYFGLDGGAPAKPVNPGAGDSDW
jgi:penicillin-binding protein 2